MTGFIYAISDGSGAVKIGWSQNPEKRLNNIQAHNPRKCDLIGVLPGKKADERRAHKQLSHHRISREWFALEGDVRAFVDAMERPAPKRVVRQRASSPAFVADYVAGRCTLQQLFRRERGLMSRIARHLGVNPGTISRWHRVPPEKTLAVEQFTGISRYDLRPDIYGPAPEKEGVE